MKWYMTETWRTRSKFNLAYYEICTKNLELLSQVLWTLNVKKTPYGILRLTFLSAWQVKIIAEEDGEDDNTAMGELCVKSPSLFKEYYKLPEVLSSSSI